MHVKFTSDNELETITKKSKNLYLTLGTTYDWKNKLEPANN